MIKNGAANRETDMHYTRNYTELEGAAKTEAALNDIKEFLGVERFEGLTATLKEFGEKQPLSKDRFAALVSISGVQGYPVMVWYNHCFPKKEDDV